MTQPDQADRMAALLKAIVEALPDSPPSCLVGALAVNAWGRLRATQDIDLLVLADEPARAALLASLATHSFEPDRTWIELNPMAKDRVLRLRHPDFPSVPLDLIWSCDVHEESALSRRRSLDVLGRSIWVCSPEDLILLKLKAGRPHDFEDALSVIKNPHLRLDLDYLWNWADRLGLHGELHYVMRAAGAEG